MKHWTTLMVLLTGLLLLVAGCARLTAVSASEAGQIEVVMRDNKFEPRAIRVKAGQTVQIVLRNEGKKLHEFMIGRDVVVVGNLTEGFAEDLLLAVMPEVTGPGMVMGMPEAPMEGMDMGDDGDEHVEEGGMEETDSDMAGMDTAAETGDDEHVEDMGGAFGVFQMPAMEDHAGLMVMIDPVMIPASEETIVTFTVPEDMVGTWEFGCFQELGQHYDDGMRGTLIVEP